MGMKIGENNVPRPPINSRGIRPGGANPLERPFPAGGSPVVSSCKQTIEQRLKNHPNLEPSKILERFDNIEKSLGVDIFKIFAGIISIYNPDLQTNIQLEGLITNIINKEILSGSSFGDKEAIWRQLLVFDLSKDLSNKELFFPLATMVQVAHLIFLNKNRISPNIDSPLKYKGRDIKILLEALSPKPEIYNFYRIAKDLVGANQAETISNIQNYVARNFKLAGEEIKEQVESLYATNRQAEIDDPLMRSGFLSELWQRGFGTEEHLNLIVNALCQSIGVPFSGTTGASFKPREISSLAELEEFRIKERNIPLLSDVLSVWKFSPRQVGFQDESLYQNNLSVSDGSTWHRADEDLRLEGDAHLKADMTVSLQRLGDQFSFSATIQPEKWDGEVVLFSLGNDSSGFQLTFNPQTSVWKFCATGKNKAGIEIKLEKTEKGKIPSSNEWHNLLLTYQNSGKVVFWLDDKEVMSAEVPFDAPLVKFQEGSLKLFQGFKGVIENGLSLWCAVMSKEKIKEIEEKQKKKPLQADSPTVLPPIQNINISGAADPVPPPVPAMQGLEKADKSHNAGLALWNKYLKYQEYAANLERNQLKRAAKIGLWFGIPTPLVAQTAIKIWQMLNSAEYFVNLVFPYLELGAGLGVFSLTTAISYFVKKLIMRSTKKGLGLLGKKDEDARMKKFLGIVREWSQTDAERFKVLEAFITKAETPAQVDWVIDCVVNAKENESLMHLSQVNVALMERYVINQGVLRRTVSAELEKKLEDIQKEIKQLPLSMRDLSCAEEVEYTEKISDLQKRLIKLSEERNRDFEKDREDLPVLLGEIKIFWQVVKKISTERKNEMERLGDSFGLLWGQISDILCEQNISKTGTAIFGEASSIPREEKPLTEEFLQERFFDAINRVQQTTDSFRAGINLSQGELHKKQSSILDSILTEEDFVGIPRKLIEPVSRLQSQIESSGLIFTPPTKSEEWNTVGDYTVCKLGQGGFADIYLTQDEARILKRLKPQHMNYKELRRLQKEAIAQSRVVHPNIAQVYEMDEKNYWLVTEYIKGITLKDWLDVNNKGLIVVQALAILFQIAEGLEAALVEGVFHRDISPRNIMLSVKNPVELVKILDFGMCKFPEGGPAYEEIASDPKLNTASVQFSRMLGGTLNYLAPEQTVISLREKGKLNFKVDQFALGTILYQMLTGNLPFNYENTGFEAWVQHGINWDKGQLSLDLTKIPLKLHSLLNRLIKRDPRERYPDYQELKNDILKIVRGYLI